MDVNADMIATDVDFAVMVVIVVMVVIEVVVAMRLRSWGRRPASRGTLPMDCST